MLSRTRLGIIFALFIIFWLLPALAMHFVPAENGLLTTQDFTNFTLLRNTMVIALVAVLVSLIFGLPAAYYLAYADFAFRNFFSVMLLLPLSIPPFISAIGWLHLTNYAVQGETVPSILMAGIVFGFSYFPIIALFSAIGFMQIDKRIEESARLTHSDRTVFFSISVPLARSFILAGTILVILFVILDYGVADFFMIRTYSIELFTQFSLHNLRGAVTATYPLLLFAMGLALLESLLIRNSSYIPSTDTLEGGLRKRSRWAPFLFSLLIVVSAGIPLGAIIHMAGGISHYVHGIRSSAVAFSNTIIFGILSAFAIAAFGFIWAQTIDSLKRGKTLLKMLSNVNLAIPGGLIAISLILMWNRPIFTKIYQTGTIVILAHFARFSSIAFKAIMAPFTTTAQRLKDLSNMFSGSYLLKLRYVFLPLSRNGLLFGFLIAFLFSTRELSSVLLILPPGKETVPIRIFSLIHYGAYEHVAVLSLGLVAMGFAVSLLVLALISRIEGRSQRSDNAKT